eukprot:1921674-Rhodomonas_salina.1
MGLAPPYADVSTTEPRGIHQGAMALHYFDTPGAHTWHPSWYQRTQSQYRTPPSRYQHTQSQYRTPPSAYEATST